MAKRKLDDLVAQDFPPLPEIKDPTILSSVLTHQGIVKASQNASHLASYERYEFLGDGYLELFAKRLLFRRFPELSVGRLSSVKDTLVQNSTLASYAVHYKLGEKATLPANLSGNRLVKVLGDLMEAYLAGIIESNPEKGDGERIAEEWMRRLWEPLLRRLEEEGPPKNGREDLLNKLGGKEVKLDYRDERNPIARSASETTYFVAVYITGWGRKGLFLGRGSGPNKREASQKAAIAALGNHAVIDELVTVKRQHDERVRNLVNDEAARNGRSYDEQLKIKHKEAADRKARMLENDRLPWM